MSKEYFRDGHHITIKLRQF